MEGRTQFVVAWMALLYVCSWMFSLTRLLDNHFWSREAALAYNRQHYVATDLYNSTAFGEINETYFTPRRYCYLLPHVLGAFFWWNLYFLQLIPQVRHAFDKKFHRILGRCLMVCAFLQISSGVGLALTSHSNVILIVSLVLGMASFYCIFHAWRYAIHRDIPKHKYWVLRLVGYLQTIALQRFFIVALITTHQMGWYGLYPELGEETSLDEANRVVLEMFDDSFLLSALTAFIGTEWYLAGMQGMLEPPVPSAAYAATSVPKDLPPHESHPLIAK